MQCLALALRVRIKVVVEGCRLYEFEDTEGDAFS